MKILSQATVIVFFSSLLICFPLRAEVQALPVKPEVWMMPPSPNASDGRVLRELFTHPDQWKETRSKIDVLGYADWVMNKQFTDAELKAWLPMLNTWGLKLGLEVGALKPWGQTGKEAFEKSIRYWDRIQSLGGKIYMISMDEPLKTCRFVFKKPDSYAVEQTAQYIALVRQRYPNMLIEDTETYPSISPDDHIAWIDALQSRLKQMGVHGLDSYRIDCNWVAFTVSGALNYRPTSGNWAGVKKIEDGCRARNIPFDLTYWASDEPALQKMGLADDSTWYIDIMAQGNAYALVGGTPDKYCIESWIGVPLDAIPETDQWTFTRSVLDFCNRFVKTKK